MKISAGLILTDGDKLLVGHATGQKHWDIPKGGIDVDESPLDACIREAKEETGLVITSSEIKDLGEFDYNSNKRLHLFLRLNSDLPAVETLTCTSTFIDHTGQTKFEFDEFKYINFVDVDKYCAINMARVVSGLRYKVIAEICKFTEQYRLIWR